MKTVLWLILALASATALADDLHITRPDRIETFTGCTTMRLHVVDNLGHLSMYCPSAPTLRKNPLGLSAPGNSLAWDWYVSDAHRVWAGEGCSLRAHLSGAYGDSVTELECPEMSR